jgi:16S rRNA (adenine1518-N6/adenine1519-N6)-dimethyltransferase
VTRLVPPRPYPRARKRFGQHFLEPVWAEKLVRAIAPSKRETLLEIGPGRGVMTDLLARSAGHVLAYEIDRDLARLLKQASVCNVHVVEGDFLEATADGIRDALNALQRRDGPLRVVGNLPYNVASPVLFKLVELLHAGLPLVDATVMLQREVAARLLAAPATREYGVLTVLIGHSARLERVLQLPPGAFRPVPSVSSTVVRLTFHDPSPPVLDEARFAALTQAIFTRRRKTLRNAVLAYESAPVEVMARALEAAAIDAQRRPETLSIAELAGLSDRLSELLTGR